MAIELEPLYLRFDRYDQAPRRLPPSPCLTHRRPALRVNTAQRAPYKRPMSSVQPILAPIPKTLPSSRIHAAHNDSQPISKLPAELLVCIINVARELDLSANEHPSGRVASFSLVCRRFRKTLLSAPQLWSTIAIHANATYGLQFAALCLTRAGNALLELWLDSFFSAAQVVPFIAPHEDRIRHIRLRVPLDAPPALVASTCAFQVPNLESLDVAPLSEPGTRTPLTLPVLFGAGCNDWIARLKLVDCAPPPGTYPALTHLHLSGRIPGLVHLLCGCATSLRTLFLDKIDCEDAPPDETPIELSSLDRLSVVAVPAFAGANFFDRLALRSQCQIRVHCHTSPSMDDETTPAFATLRAMRSLLDSRASHADALQLCVDGTRVRLVLSGESRASVAISARATDPTETSAEDEEVDWTASAVRELLQTLPLDSIRSVWIAAEDDLPVDIMAVLSALTSVREFVARGVALANVSRALSTAAPTGLVCPKLETLGLQMNNSERDALAVLRGALEARIAHGMRLWRLDLQGIAGADTNELKDLVDELRVVNDDAIQAPSSLPEWTG